jgi:hypothetical protein
MGNPTRREQIAPPPPSSGANAVTDTQLRANPLPVCGSISVTGPLTNAELRATPVPVSGTVNVSFPSSMAVTGSFYPATQPVSGTVGISGTVPVSGTFWQATQPVSIAATVAVSGPLTDAQLRATPVPVSGSFYPATQPVSIASMPTTPVTGNFWQATQPVSIAGTVNVAGGLTDTQLRASALPVSGTFFQATQPVSIAGTVATREAKNAGRTQFSAATVIGGVAAVTTEALLSMVPVRAGAAAASATSIQATSGKTLRLVAIIFSTRSTSAAVLSGRCALRMNPSGAVVASSPILAILSCAQQAAALAEAGDTCVLPLPDGIEISGTQQVGLTQLCSAATGVVYATIIGFEY